jgi:hypothetical protein
MMRQQTGGEPKRSRHPGDECSHAERSPLTCVDPTHRPPGKDKERAAAPPWRQRLAHPEPGGLWDADDASFSSHSAIRSVKLASRRPPLRVRQGNRRCAKRRDCRSAARWGALRDQPGDSSSTGPQGGDEWRSRRELRWPVAIVEVYPHPGCGRLGDPLPLHVRTWTGECGAVRDRDSCAAHNLQRTRMAASR